MVRIHFPPAGSLQTFGPSRAPCRRWVASRLRIGQGLDCRPQLLDQPLAVANLSPLIDTGQRVPQCQKPLAAERRRVQSFLRRDDNLALADCGRRLAAQRDAVIADDVGAHGGFSWLVRRPAAAGAPLTLSSPPKATLLWIILWRCCAAAEH